DAPSTPAASQRNSAPCSPAVRPSSPGGPPSGRHGRARLRPCTSRLRPSRSIEAFLRGAFFLSGAR
ncbi:Uncharacterized protein HZ326_31608, partial [Fusarium oxysporum f. sp. albedinis]